MKTQIMYIESKGEDEGPGEARIGRVRFSKTRKTIYYQNQTFQTLQGAGFKTNYFDVETGEGYWISGCRKDGADRLYGERLPIYIDEEVQETYWREIRSLPEKVGTTVINGRK